MRPIQRIRFGAEDQSRFVLLFDKGDGKYALIVAPLDKETPTKLAPYLSIAAVVFLLPAGANAIVDLFEDPKRPKTLVFDYEVFNCINAYTTRLNQDEIKALNAAGMDGECGCECPPNSGFWVQIVCPDPIGTNATCDGTSVQCV